jgi:hypothetical protein
LLDSVEDSESVFVGVNATILIPHIRIRLAYQNQNRIIILGLSFRVVAVGDTKRLRASSFWRIKQKKIRFFISVLRSHPRRSVRYR